VEKFSCAFTGHDPANLIFRNEEVDPLCIKIKEAMRAQMLALFKNGVNTFYTDCEPGVGLWAAELAIEINEKYPDGDELHLICVMPHEGQADDWNEDLRDRFFMAHEKSFYVNMLSTQYTNKCYRQCSKYLIDHAEYLIAVYESCQNGNVTLFENAAYRLSYAKAKGREIIYIDPNTAEVTTLS
jgi:uncharacterized phage-like protein YoqJ